MKNKLLLGGLVVLVTNFGHSQGFVVYHAVGPAMFTNSTDYGYGDGQRVTGNYICAVYAGTDPAFLQPVFQQHPASLSAVFSTSGTVVLSGSFTASSMTGVWMQFRAWPAVFDTYETALTQQPGVPVGVSALYPAIRAPVIIELPIQTGLMWVQPIPEPSSAALGFAALLLFLGQIRFQRS